MRAFPPSATSRVSFRGAFFIFVSAAAAFLELLAAAARTRIVSAYLGLGTQNRFLGNRRALGEVPSAACLLKVGQFMVLFSEALFPVMGNKLDVPFGVLRASGRGIQNLQPVPLRIFGPCPGSFMVVTLPVVR